MPPRRSFGPDESALDDSPESPEPTGVRRLIGRISFGNSLHRPSFASRWRNSSNEEGITTPGTERPPIPSMMQSSAETYATPLPILSMIVLSITMLGEFLSANVSTPFVLFMVRGFGEFTEADIAFWTGILVSTFFLTQFLTAILWATVADRHGRRFVLVVSLLGSAVTCVVFGTCRTLEEAICVRLLQGVFAGAVGVARGSVSFVTDPTNEGRAYAIMGFCWGMGGVAGAIVGGSFERPAVKWPGVFEDTLFVTYPYLLPCAVAASVTLIGSILACFLGPDGGPREGRIRLLEKPEDAHPPISEEDAEESRPPTPVFEEDGERASLAGTIRRKFSGYFAKRVPDAPSLAGSPGISQTAPVRLDRTRTFSRTNGSSYGYAGSFRARLASNATAATNRRGSNATSTFGTLRRRHGSTAEHRDSTTSDLNFAQRLLMANENAVTNIADLWVAAAMNVDGDNEDPFESDSEEEEGTEGEDLLTPTPARRASAARRSSGATVQRPFRLGSPRRGSTTARQSFSQPLDGSPAARRFSVGVPSIFAHPGVRTPPAVLDAQQLLRAESEAEEPGLEPILESRRASLHDPFAQHEVDLEAGVAPEAPPSMASQLPVLVIVQYGLLALHTTTHDQVFLSYLVSGYDEGGLNLEPGHFSQLIALMCLAQIAYQFYLYPNIGPPRGRFSHLAMFRIGSALFIPAYLVVTLLRPLASAEDDGNFTLMFALAVNTALRYCGSTFGYTSVSILLNYMTPPHAVGLANGIAQSIVSLARCFGPVLGGYLWSVSVQDNPAGYPLGFIACAGVCALSVLHSFLIR
ncbi:major facilitator MFS-1 [Mycena rosella]|uniref:Major facilitator MFS-1 n=1 Tax=Mycena rosella TaxID=1033263 RepID=A0AAD7GE00_MYCRO|nr:major facilitator MFS-1 [Mycena rosella]